jgi:hypothetical protein
LKQALVFMLVAGTALFVACDENEGICADCCEGCPPPPPTHEFKALTEREDVLNNIELSYNKRRIAPHDELLDPNFTFFFSPGDVGGNIPEQWGRVDEMAVTTRLFDSGLNQPPYPTCRSIRMDLKFESGVVWVEVIPSDFPDEVWYTTTVYYEFTFEMEPDMTYIAVPGSQAQFTVRNVGTDAAPQWRLVEWRDLASANFAALRSNTGTQASTWGTIKALYI